MLRSISTKAFFAIATPLVALLAIVGAIHEYVQQRDEMWGHAAAETGGDPQRGEAMFIGYGCGSCHSLKNVRGATGMVGPPLDGIAMRVIIGGHLSNNPANMQKWIRDPQQVSPGTAMPDLNVGAQDARDINAFLYTRAK